MTLALGRRKMRAELRRRVNAWKEPKSLSDYAVMETIEEHVIQLDESVQEEVVTPIRIRKSFHTRFRQWPKSDGAEAISKLRWTIPTSQIALQSIKMANPFSNSANDTKILTALTSHGVPRLDTITRKLGQRPPELEKRENYLPN